MEVAHDVGTKHLGICVLMREKQGWIKMLNQMNSNDLSSLSASLKDWKFDQEKSQKKFSLFNCCPCTTF